MLKVDTHQLPSERWAKVQALSSFLQLKSGNSSAQTACPELPSSVPRDLTAKRLKIFIGTWNMYGRLLPIDLESFLTKQASDGNNSFVEHQCSSDESPFLDTSTAHPYHLLAIGTQECERDISESLFYPSKELWEQRLSDHLGERYQLLRCETLAALHLAVFVWKPVASYVKNIHSGDIKTGWANMVGNKGAVAVSLDFGSKSLLFINCHLRAHQTKLAERNANVHRILHELQIKGGKATHTHTSGALFHLPSFKKLSRSSKSTKKPPRHKRSSLASNHSATSSRKEKTKKKKRPSSGTASSPSPPVRTEDQHSVTERFDHVFIFGDTNYRINADRHFVLENIQKKDFRTLLKYDQLTVEREKGTTPLASFSEHPINFIPTYKFDTLAAVATHDSSSSSLHTSPTSFSKSTRHLHHPCTRTSPASTTPTTAIASSSSSTSSSTSESCIITPTDSVNGTGNISLRYDTSPKQRVPSWTDRILWHDRLASAFDNSGLGDIAEKTISETPTMTPASVLIPRSGATMTTFSTASGNQQQSKSKLNLNWISALKRKGKNSQDNDQVTADKSTVCYHYNTVLDSRLMGASDHLPVIGIFGVWFDDWESNCKRARSVKSTKKTVLPWKKWL